MTDALSLAGAVTRLNIRLALAAPGFIIGREATAGLDAVSTLLAQRPDACVIRVHLTGRGVVATRAGEHRRMLTVSTDEDALLAAIPCRGLIGPAAEGLSERAAARAPPIARGDECAGAPARGQRRRAGVRGTGI